MDHIPPLKQTPGDGQDPPASALAPHPQDDCHTPEVPGWDGECLWTERALRVLSSVSSALLSTLDHAAIPEQVVRLTVPAIADWCVVDLLMADQSTAVAATAHVDPVKEASVRKMLRRYCTPGDTCPFLARALRSRKPVLVEAVTSSVLGKLARDDGHLCRLRSLKLRSLVTVPLVARDRIQGGITFAITETDRRYETADLPLFEELARRVALALDNARLYGEAHQEIAQRKKAEMALWESRARHWAVVRAFDGFIYICSDDYRVEYANEQMALYCGGDPVGRLCYEALHGLNTVCPWCVNERVFRGETVRWDVLSPKNNRWYHVVDRPLVYPDGRVYKMSVFHDIDDRKRAEEALAQADQRKDDFLAMLAHELRNPLGAISNAAYLLRRRAAKGQSLDATLAVLERQVRHSARLMDDLLDVSRITRGKMQLRLETVDLATVITSAIEVVRPFIESNQHELTVSLPAEPISLHADPTRLEQVLLNLLNNAAKYTVPGGHISLSAAREGDQAVLRVRDDGIGISSELLPIVFDIFVQADRSKDRSKGGLGLGLTLVQGLVGMHGGSVEAHSEGLGKGSEFVVRLPILPAAPRAATSGEGGEVSPRQPLRILMAEDNEDSALTLSAVLEMVGHTVRVVKDGLAAVDAARDFHPEVCLLDLGLPGIDGHEVARRLRAEPEGARMLLIAISGYGQAEDRKHSAEAGFDHHLTKPVDFAELQRLLAQEKAG